MSYVVYRQGKGPVEQNYTMWLGAQKQFGFENQESNFVYMIDTMFYHAYMFLFGGPTGVFTTSDLINGFDSDLWYRVSPYYEEELSKGNAIYLDSWVSPITSSIKATYTAYTGSTPLGKAGQLSQMNGLNHTNKAYVYYDGDDLSGSITTDG